MFEWMNRHKKNIMKYTLYLVIPSFVLLYGYGKCAEPPVYQWVAKVNGEQVTDVMWRNMQTRIEENMRQRYGSDRQIPREEIQQQALSSAITATLFEQKLEKWGIATTDQEVAQSIRQQPYFQDENKQFNIDVYRNVLMQNRIHPLQYEESQRDQLTKNKISTLVQESIFRTSTDKERMGGESKEKVNIEYLAFEPSKYVEDVTPTEEGLQDYFENNIEEFRVPEQRRIAYAKFEPANFMQNVTVDEYSLERFFQRNQQQFEIPEKRRVRYLAYTAEPFTNQVSVTDEEIQAQYENNTSQFTLPEKVKVRYAVQPLAALAKQQSVTEEAIAEYYENNQNRWEHGEQAKASHILLRVTPGISAEEEEEIKNRLLEIRKEIEEGLAFSEAAKKYSQDVGSAENGGDLGYFNRGDMVPEFDQAAFELPLGQMSEPIKTQFGYHLLLVEDRKEAGTDTLEDVRDDIRETLQKQQAVSEFRAYADSLSSLEEVEDEYEIKTTDWFARGDEIPGISRRERFYFSSAAFTASEGEISMAGNTMSENLYLIEQLDHQPSRPMTLEEARQDVIEDVKEKKAEELARLAAQSDAEQIKSASLDLATVAKERGLSVQVSGLFGREDQFIPGFGPRPMAIMNTAFTLEEGEISGALETQSGNYIIQLLAQEPPRLPELEEVQREVEMAYRQSEAQNLAKSEAIAFGNTLFDKQIPLMVEAATREIESGTTEFFAESEPIPGLGFKREINQQAFRMDEIGQISDEFEVMTSSRTPQRQQQQQLDGFYVIELLEIQDSYLPELAEVREDVEQEYRLVLAEEIARKEAEKTLEAMKAELASSQPLSATQSIDLQQFEDTGEEDHRGGKGATYRGPYAISKTGSVSGIGNAPAITKTAFALEPGQVSDLIANYRMKYNEDRERVRDNMTGVYIVQVLNRVEPSDEEDQAASFAQQMEQYMEQRMQGMAFSAWIDEVSSESKIVYHEEYLNPSYEDEEEGVGIEEETKAETEEASE